MLRVFTGIAEVEQAVGEHLGPTDWHTITQNRVDTFADATDDHQWIHVDPARAASGPFGATIAHGFLTLSLVSKLLSELYRVEHVPMSVNYGLNKVRFPSPVTVGSRVRANATIAAVQHVSAGVQLVINVMIEIEGGAKPACVAEMLVLLVP